jgi:hypothetical protein
MDVILKQGELVAIPAYFEGQKYPGRVILAVVDEQITENKFKAKGFDLVVLDPFEMERAETMILPLVRETIGTDSYFTRWGSRSGWYEVWLVNNYSRGEIYCGFETIINFLSYFPEFKPHVVSLNATRELLKERAEREALEASMHSAAI